MTVVDNVRALVGEFRAIHEILDVVCLKCYGPTLPGGRGLLGYWGHNHVNDSVLEIQGKRENARPFRKDIGAHSRPECHSGVVVTLEAYCDRCDSVIIHWRGFFAGSPHISLVGTCNGYPDHASRESDWRWKVIEVSERDPY